MKRLTPGIWRLLVLSVIALGLLAGGCSSEPPPPCRPLDDGEIEALEDRFWSARRANLEALQDLNQVYETVWGNYRAADAAARQGGHTVDLVAARNMAESTARQVPNVSNDLRDSGQEGSLNWVLEYFSLGPLCERELANDYAEGLRAVQRVWHAISELEKDVREAEQVSAASAREVERARALLKLSETRMKEITEQP